MLSHHALVALNVYAASGSSPDFGQKQKPIGRIFRSALARQTHIAAF
jgi:hypothetical protein